MSIKRKTDSIHETDSKSRRLTRSSAVALGSSDIHTDGLASPRRKRRQATDLDAEIENSRVLQSPRPTRKYGRRVNQLVYIANRDKVPSDSETDDLDAKIDTPRRTRRRIILEAVEITSPRKTSIKRRLDGSLITESTTDAFPSCMDRLSTVALLPPTTNNQEYQKLKENLTLKTEEELPEVLPEHLAESLERQKQAILDAFHASPLVGHHLDGSIRDTFVPAATATALRQLDDLLLGSIERGEGNSCLIIGPSGSGKSKVFEEALKKYERDYRPIVIRLNGHVHYTDRLAIREIARQALEQTGSKTFESIDIGDDDGPFDDSKGGIPISSLPPPSHLPSLIASLPSLPRPVVVLLDAFNIFTEQPRQGLLYCLLDTVQSCRAGSSSQRGLAVVGLTSRIDVVNFLEKRVKSRFSHRMLRTASMTKFENWTRHLRKCLCADIKASEGPVISEWDRIWEHSVQRFLEDRTVKDALNDMFGITGDIRHLFQAMASVIVSLTPTSPYLTSKDLRQTLNLHFSTPLTSLLTRLNYPSLSLCIAAQHACTAGHDSFTFELLYDLFFTQVRTSSAAPVMIGGGSIGMVNIGRQVLMGAFEDLVRTKIFLQASPSNGSLRKEFVKYRCTAERDEIKAAIERVGQTNLKKWFSKAQ